MCAQLLSTQPYKGTRDFYPEDMRLRNWFFGKIRTALEKSAFDEYNGPMLESLELYAAKSGEEIAQKIFARHEMLTSFLVSIGVDEKTASEDACRMEHVISDETYEKIKNFCEKQS